ncbi:ADP-ribosyltransferase, partial [Streptomyces sp. NPDC060031]|uniref:ADP-ribosyltransferase n=1 Tax=Streptomyces sp. NPDC060031 TaxID=3347043 RepID=UPI0036B17235
PMTYVFKGAGAGISKIGDVMAGFKGIGKIDLPSFPEGSVQLPDGRVLDPNGNLFAPTGIAETTPIPHEMVPGTELPKSWTLPGAAHVPDSVPTGVAHPTPAGSFGPAPAAFDPVPAGAGSHVPAPHEMVPGTQLPKSWTIQQPVMAGAHIGDGLPGAAHVADSVPTGVAHPTPAGSFGPAPAAFDPVPTGAGSHVPTGPGSHVPAGPGSHLPGEHLPSGAGHDLPGTAPHTPDGPYGPGHADDAVSHADDAAHAGDDAAHADHGGHVDPPTPHGGAGDPLHGADDAGTGAGHHGTDRPGTGDAGEPFKYTPHVSVDDWAGLTNAQRHQVALAELTDNTVPFARDTDAISYGQAYWNHYADDMPPARQKAVWDYTDEPNYSHPAPHADGWATYNEMNGYLRGDSAKWSSYVQHNIDEVDSALAGHPVPEDVMVVRGTGISHLKLDDPLDMLGKEYGDPAYMSTSLGNHPVSAFAGKEAILHLRVPKGTPALWVENVGKFGQGERELLLGRGTTYRVTRVFMENGQVQVYGEVLPRF